MPGGLAAHQRAVQPGGPVVLAVVTMRGVVGIGAVSAARQLALAATGALLGARVSPGLRTLFSLVGYAVAGGFAVAPALP